MSPREVLLAAAIFLVCCSIASGTRYPNTWKISRRKCVTQYQARCPIRRKVSCYGRNNGMHSPWRDRFCNGNSGKCCYRHVYVSCIVSVVHCCAGWTSSGNGRCNVAVPTNICDGGCENNGACDRVAGICMCQPGFTGRRCERVICNPLCENGGMCVSVNGTPQCKCPRAFQGATCETAVCDGTCENGGECVAVGTRAQCSCPDGFTGRRCEIAAKEGQCSLPSYIQPRNCSLEHRCEHDQQCPGDQKCCKNLGCGGHYCDSIQMGCLFNETLLKYRAKFYPNPCTVCTCINPGSSLPYKGAICAQVRCPPIPPGYHRCKRKSPIRGDNQCCKVCKEPEGRKPPNYTVPVFVNCPKEGIVLDLPETGRTVAVPQTLVEAVDMRSRKLRVEYSKRNLTWNSDIDKNFHLIIATAMDEWEEVVECPLIVRVRDSYPPVFSYCPHDIGPVPGPVVNWASPTARDNVGLAGPPESDFMPGQRFLPGQTLVAYTVEDLEGNEELCQFSVFVEPTMVRTTEQLPTTTYITTDIPGITERLEKTSSYSAVDGKLYLFIGFGLLLFLLIVIGCIFLLLKRRRESKSLAQTPSVAFSTPIGPPPPYAAVAVNNAAGLYQNMAVKTLVSDSNPLESFDNPIYSSDDVSHNQQNNINHQNSQVIQ